MSSQIDVRYYPLLEEEDAAEEELLLDSWEKNEEWYNPQVSIRILSVLYQLQQNPIPSQGQCMNNSFTSSSSHSSCQVSSSYSPPLCQSLGSSSQQHQAPTQTTNQMQIPTAPKLCPRQCESNFEYQGKEEDINKGNMLTCRKGFRLGMEEEKTKELFREMAYLLKKNWQGLTKDVLGFGNKDDDKDDEVSVSVWRLKTLELLQYNETFLKKIEHRHDNIHLFSPLFMFQSEHPAIKESRDMFFSLKPLLERGFLNTTCTNSTFITPSGRIKHQVGVIQVIPDETGALNIALSYQRVLRSEQHIPYYRKENPPLYQQQCQQRSKEPQMLGNPNQLSSADRCLSAREMMMMNTSRRVESNERCPQVSNEEIEISDPEEADIVNPPRSLRKRARQRKPHKFDPNQELTFCFYNGPSAKRRSRKQQPPDDYPS